MKLGWIILLLALILPASTYGQEVLRTEKVEATVEESGNWTLTEYATGITWQGEWITASLMKVTGSDNSCFILGENTHGLVQLDCHDLTQISILLSY